MLFACCSYEDEMGFLSFMDTPDTSRAYVSDTDAWEMGELLENELVHLLRKEVQSSVDYLSIAVDETSTTDMVEYVGIELRFWKPKVGICHRFVKLAVIRACDAASLYEVVHSVLCEVLGCTSEQLAAKMVGAGTDGASAMSGPLSGMVVRLQERFPHLLGTHCSGHRVALVAAKLMDVPEFARLERLLKAVNKWFCKSPQRQAAFRDYQNLEGLTYLKPIKVHAVRWLSVGDALERLIKIWEPCLCYFKVQAELMEPDCVFIYNEMCDIRVLLAAHGFTPLLSHMRAVTKFVQGEHVFAFDIAEAIDHTCAMLKEDYETERTAFKDRKRFEAWQVFTVAQDSPLQWDDEDELVYNTQDRGGNPVAHKMYVGGRGGVNHTGAQVVAGSRWDDLVKEMKEVCKKASKAQHQFFVERFPKTSLLKALAVCDLRYWEPVKRLGARTAMVDIDVLIKQFAVERTTKDGVVIPPLVDQDALETQESTFIAQMQQTVGCGMNTEQYWLYVESHAQLSDRLSAYLALARLVFTLPTGSVGCERLFSRLKLTKNRLRSKLGERHVNVCIRLSSARLNGVTYATLDTTRVLKAWHELKDRRKAHK